RREPTAKPGTRREPTAKSRTRREPTAKSRPAAEVWPAAVSRIPVAAADGWKYRPITALGPTKILLVAESSFEKAGRLEVYDTESKQSSVLTEMPDPEGVKGYFAQDVEVGPDYIAWYGKTPNNDDAWADLWVTPRSGGTPVQIAEITGERANVDGIGVTKDHVVWSVTTGGVYRTPITGGEIERIPGTGGLHLLSWPWATDIPKLRIFKKNQTVLANLETGERLNLAAPPGVAGMRCDPVWCVGQSKDGVVAQRVDGSERRTLPIRSIGPFVGVHLGRFVYNMQTIYDLATGTSAKIGATSGDGKWTGLGPGLSSSPSAILYWATGGYTTKEVCHRPSQKEIDRLGLSNGRKPPQRFCDMKIIDGTKKFEVLNMAAIPPAE
ncbi:MAG TPA: hypothetical protein VIR33_12210, partial [Thermopolyspora sp.]